MPSSRFHLGKILRSRRAAEMGRHARDVFIRVVFIIHIHTGRQAGRQTYIPLFPHNCFYFSILFHHLLCFSFLPRHNFSTHTLFTHNLSPHNLLTFTLSTHNLLTHNFLTHDLLTHGFLVAHANPSPSLFSFLHFPCHLYLSFAACWKKLTCGVIRSFIFFSMSKSFKFPFIAQLKYCQKLDFEADPNLNFGRTLTKTPRGWLVFIIRGWTHK